MVSANPAPPVVAVAGLMAVIDGILLCTPVIVKITVLVVPPPGGSVITATLAWPAFSMSVERIWASISEVVWNSEDRGEPFQVTSEAGVKCEPKTCSVKAGWPADMFAGLSEVIAGAGDLISCWQAGSNNISRPTN